MPTVRQSPSSFHVKPNRAGHPGMRAAFGGRFTLRSSTMNDPRSSLSRESIAIVALTLVGALLRFWAFGRLGLSHFDEGIYAFSGLWIAGGRGTHGLDPTVIPYAPPGFPILIGLSYLAFGITDLSAILAATLCGVATIPVVGWLGRRTFGPGAGAASATFATFALVHIAFSRKALTDAPFLLAWLVAFGLGSRFLESPGFARAIALGVAVGLAQNLKYNGWLAGALVIVTAITGHLLPKGERRIESLLRTLGWGLLAAFTAVILYAPWYRFVDDHGGYAALLAHHRGYLGGPASWWSHWKTQLHEASVLAGTRRWGAMCALLAWFLAGMAAHGARILPSWTSRAAAVALSSLGIFATLFTLEANLGWWLGLVWTPRLLLASSPSLRLLGHGWLVLSILTPFYHPYARLWLPLRALGWLMTGGCLVRIALGRDDPRVRSAAADDIRGGRLDQLGRAGALVALACVVLAAFQRGPASSPIRWGWILEPAATTSPKHFVLRTLPSIDDLHGKSLLVLARQPIAFYLAEQGRYPFRRVSGLEPLLHPARPDLRLLVDEAMLIQEGDPDEGLARLLRYWRLEKTFVEEVEPITLLDLHPAATIESADRPTLHLWLLSPRIPPGDHPTDGADLIPR